MEINESAITLTLGGQPQVLNATATPSDSTITWTIADVSIASIGGGASTQGSGCAVMPVAEGNTTITASITVDGKDYTDTCTITVNS